MAAVRYSVGFALALAVVALPLSTSAQGSEPVPKAPTSEPTPEEPCPKGRRGGAVGGIVVGSVFLPVLPMSIPVLITQSQKLKAHNRAMRERRCQYASEEPALELQLDEAGVGVVPPTPRTPDGYTLEELSVRVRRAKIGLGASGIVYALGLGLTLGGVACVAPNWSAPMAPGCAALYGSGLILATGGLVGMIVSGVRLAGHKRERERLQRSGYRTPGRAQWDLARSRLVF